MSAAEPSWPSTVAQALLSRRRREWSEEERAGVWEDLLPAAGGRGRFFGRFVTLSVLSTVLASFGLIANSIATLIAGMLLDPLMTPVLGIAASILHGRARRLSHCRTRGGLRRGTARGQKNAGQGEHNKKGVPSGWSDPHDRSPRKCH